MTVHRFQKPGAEPEQPVQEKPAMDPTVGRSCAKDHYPFRAYRKRFDGSAVCSVYCVPNGPCEGFVQSGVLRKELSITSEGTCSRKAFPQAVPVSNMTLFWMRSAGGKLCPDMTMRQFSRPALPTTTVALPTLDPALGRTCGPEFVPYRAVATFAGKSLCSAYCVPMGECEGMAQMGRLKMLGITSEGGCEKKDFPEAAPISSMIQYMVKTTGVKQCAGMTVHKFQARAAPPGKVAATGGEPAGPPALAPSSEAPNN
mmetsp:Transcript_95881/g.271410  ORF Transcript_95881/g.271410 Transcript_95881/m.271410 type:complete len:257 (+) Transcript_95881:2-772(+)